MLHSLLTVLLVPAFFSQINAAVNVTLYYESLCSDTINFFKYQLRPAYQDLGKSLKVEFVPFGKASWRENPWTIQCQHGPRECYGNAIQACALERYKEPEMQVKFITCMMTNAYPDTAGPYCAKILGYDYSGIEQCASGIEGRRLHIIHGTRTKTFKPPITFIPTIAFNDVYNADDQRLSLTQFKRVVCSKFSPNERPNVCQGH